MSKSSKAKRIILIVLAVILVLGGTVGGFAVFGTFSDGFRTGRIIKLSKKGVVFKTYEGQLDQGGVSSEASGDLALRIWEFSVLRSDDEVRQQIEDAAVGNYMVKLYYKEKYFQFDWRGDTKYFVYRVEKIKGRARGIEESGEGEE